jgi:hypothetical protein
LQRLVAGEQDVTHRLGGDEQPLAALIAQAARFIDAEGADHVRAVGRIDEPDAQALEPQPRSPQLDGQPT